MAECGSRHAVKTVTSLNSSFTVSASPRVTRKPHPPPFLPTYIPPCVILSPWASAVDLLIVSALGVGNSTTMNRDKKRQNNGESSEGQGQRLPRRVNNTDGRCNFCDAQRHFYHNCPEHRKKQSTTQSGGNERGDGTTANNAATTGTVTQTGQGRGDAAKGS